MWFPFRTGDPYGAEAWCVDLVAPVSGRVQRVSTGNKQVVQPSTQILEIGNLDIGVELLSMDGVRVREVSEAVLSGELGLREAGKRPSLPLRQNVPH